MFETPAQNVRRGAAKMRAEAAGQSLFYADCADDLERAAAKMERHRARETPAGVVGHWWWRPNREWTAALSMARRWLGES